LIKALYEIPNTDLKWISRFEECMPNDVICEALDLGFHEFLVDLKVWEECDPFNNNGRRICAIEISTILGNKVRFGKAVDKNEDICSQLFENQGREGEMIITTFYGIV
jgi:hypothetical protein